MLRYLKKDGQEDRLRSYIRTRGIGCNGIKLLFNGTQCHGSHIRRRAIPEEYIKQLDEGIVRYSVTVAFFVLERRATGVTSCTYTVYVTT